MQKMKQKKQKMMRKMSKNKKFGFTLGELLIVLGIIGFLTALAMTTIKPAEKKAVKYLYMNAYNSLSKAYYNAVLKGYNPFTEEEFEGLTPEHTDGLDTGAEILCKGLTYWINTGTNEKNSEHDYSTTCSSTKLTSELADDFSDDNVQFTATNGMKFYISKMLGDDELKFYLVFVDTNGVRKPNSAEYTFKGGKTAEDYDDEDPESAEKKARDLIEPDIYAFALLDTGRVCPIGIPEYDTNIMTARFGYFDTDGEPLYTKKSLAYYQAKGAAWGYYSGTLPALYNNDDEVFSMNDIVRSKINPESKIVKDFPNLSTLTPTAIAAEAPYNCSDEDLESCFVFLDEYRQ